MRQVVSDSVGAQRVTMLLLGLFAGLAIALAAVGIYGVISYSVAQRTHEFGIRMALGAERADVLRLVLAKGLSLAAYGVCAGLAGALVLTRFLSSLLFGVQPTDPIIFCGIALLLGMVALLASYIPARRATKVEPTVALRYE
jgi:putative ABC transport system permease protein